MNRQIQKVIILTGGRTGSTALVRILNSIIQIRFHGEFFLRFNKNSDCFQPYCLDQNKKLYYDYILNPRFARHFAFLSKGLVNNFLENLFNNKDFSAPWTDIEKRFDFHKNELFDSEKLVGFKLAYGCYNGYAGIWEWIKSNDVKVVHLVRNNSYEKYISWRLVAETKVFHSYQNKQIQNNVSLHINIDDLANFIEQDAKITNEFRNYVNTFENNIEVAYENLFQNESDWPILNNFLSIKTADDVLKTSSVKKLVRPNNETLIANYSQVQDFLNKNYPHLLSENK